MNMCTVKEIQEAIREDCRSQHDMDATDIDRVMQAPGSRPAFCVSENTH